jgi:hypothetical protein
LLKFKYLTIQIMKKNYMQPCVEATQLQLDAMVLAGSPAGTGIGNGGDTNSIPGTDPIPGE